MDGAAPYFVYMRSIFGPLNTLEGFPRQKSELNASLMPFCLNTIASIHPQWAQETSYYSGIGGERLLGVLAMYTDSAATQRLHLRQIAVSQLDVAHTAGGGFPVFFLKFAHLSQANAQRLTFL